MKKYYTYLLIDSTNNKVFYVGKGSGKRVSEHVRKALSNSTNVSNSTKNDRILSIYAKKGHVIEQIVARFDNEQDALDTEEAYIEMYGLNNLTNMYSKGRATPDYVKSYRNYISYMKTAVEMLSRINIRYIPEEKQTVIRSSEVLNRIVEMLYECLLFDDRVKEEYNMEIGKYNRTMYI